jgi:hypothetical protein
VKDTCARTSKAEPLIHGGTVDSYRKYPWIGAYFSNRKFSCGGSLSKIILFDKVSLKKNDNFYPSKQQTRVVCCSLCEVQEKRRYNTA